MTRILTLNEQPVIVGIGEITERIAQAGEGREPLALLTAAVRAADADGGGGWLTKIDSVDIVNVISWPYADLAGRLVETLGLEPARAVHGPVGGESPIRYLQEAARRVVAGASSVSLVCGAEAMASAMKAAQAGSALPWSDRDPNYRPIRPEDISHTEALRYGLRSPIDVYPLYENACRAHWGQGLAESQAESAAIWSRFSEVASANPHAWLPVVHAPAAIATPGPKNRPIAWPYLKLMVANNAVNQAAAVIVTSYGRAIAAGVPVDQLVFVWDGCGAMEPRDFLARDGYVESGAQQTVLTRTLERNRLTADDIDLFELYSCFPCVPKLARRTLGLPINRPMTVAGGLTFFGAPANNYMTHAATAMVRALRAGTGTTGLLYGQGEFVTKHHGLVVSKRPAGDGVVVGDHDIQGEVDSRRGAVPTLAEGYVGAGTVETHTVFFDRDGAPRQGVVIGRTEGGARFVARIPGSDQPTLAAFTDEGFEPIGSGGTAVRAGDGLVDWRIA